MRTFVPQVTSKLEGVEFKPLGDDPDCRAIASVMNESWKADGVAWMVSEEDVRSSIEIPVGSDPKKDTLLVEFRGRLVGVVVTSRDQELDGHQVLRHQCYLVPEARVQGLREAMLHWAERYLAEESAGHVEAGGREYEAWADARPNNWRDILLGEGYVPRRHLFEMKRDVTAPLPVTSLPPGLEIRPVRPEHHRRIWEASSEALMDDLDYSKELYGEDAYKRWLANPSNRINLWTVAWEEDEVVGGVGLVIKEDENRELSRKRAWTEPVFVRKPWRRKGIAHALIARANQAAMEAGMDECALDVNTGNPSGALKLYRTMGYREIYEFAFYRKPVRQT